MENEKMKFVVAIIQPHKLEEVQNALKDIGIRSMTVTQVLGCGRQDGHTEIYRGVKEVGNLLKKVKLEIAVDGDMVEKCLGAIVKGAKTGGIGDGKIFVLDLGECVRIRTEERGKEAL